MIINKEDLAWAAGFFDGEGCVYLRKKKRKRIEYGIGLHISQKNSVLLHKFQKIFNVGSINGPYEASAAYRTNPIYAYSIQNFKDVQYVIAMIWGWLGDQKKDQYIKVAKDYLEYYKTTPHYRTMHAKEKQNTPVPLHENG